MVVADQHVTQGFVTAPARPGVGISFVDDLGLHGDAVAVIDSDGSAVSYRALSDAVEERVQVLGNRRRLVVVEMANRLDSVIWYLAALRGRHAVIVTDSGPTASRLAEGFDPDAVIDQDGTFAERHAETTHRLHEDLALLLSTSGSTGASKLVRLSRQNLAANALSIASSLGIRPTDRAITSLPLHYCYGLSVLHSHLAVGAAIVLTNASVADPCFWAAVDQHQVTSIAGVPHTFDLLDRVGFDGHHHPTVRVLTQAGGRLGPDKVRRWAEAGTEQGFDLRVMYGQTEATARIAVARADDALAHPHCVGRVVPGGRVRIEPVDGHDDGELVYDGPNVMMGYANAPADLSRPAEVAELRTGDLARIGDDGLIEIVGRRSEFVKLFGLRIDLREVERTCSELGLAIEAVVGDDDGIGVAIAVDRADETDGANTADGLAAARTALARRLRIPEGSIAIAVVDPLPRLGNGKLDRRLLLTSIRDAADGRTSSDTSSLDSGHGSVTKLFASVLGVRTIRPTDTFVSLGGDSLSYVEASIRLESHLGHLPAGWHVTPVADLVTSDATGRRRHRQLETNVVLRAVAIVLILGNHTGAFLIGGGAHVLLAGAGFNLSRFQLRRGAPWASIVRLAIPAVTWIGLVAAVTVDFDLAHALLVHGWVGGRGRWSYWFVEVLVQLLVAVAVVFTVPAVRRLDARQPFVVPGVLLAATLLIRFDIIDLGTHHRMFFRPHEVAWMFILGWLAERAATTRHRIGVTAVVVAAVPGFFGDTTRELVLAGGLLALLWIRRIPLPRQLAPLVGALAGASLWIYLTHFQVHPLLSDDHPWLAIVASIVVGAGAWRLIDPQLQRLHSRLPSRRSTAAQQGGRQRDTVAA